jgi:hypothetical protein
VSEAHTIETELSDRTRDRLEDALQQRPEPLDERRGDYIRRARRTVARAIPSKVAQRLEPMRDSASPPSALSLWNGLRDPALPATPDVGPSSPHKETHVSEGWIVGICAHQGAALVRFRGEQPTILNDVVPVPEAERQLTNRGPDLVLGLHNEQAYLPSGRRVRTLALPRSAPRHWRFVSAHHPIPRTSRPLSSSAQARRSCSVASGSGSRLRRVQLRSAWSVW